jgi:Family of unknown function (DUF5678)
VTLQKKSMALQI